MLVGDIKKKDPLLTALSKLTRITAVQGRPNDPSRFCVLGGVASQAGCHSVENLPKKTTKFPFENVKGIPRVTAKKPRYKFPHHDKSLIALEGDKGNRSYEGKERRALKDKERKRKARLGDRHRGSGHLSLSGLAPSEMDEL